jgi:hypothetical protein
LGDLVLLVNKRRAVIVSVLDHDEDNAREGMFWILDGTGSKSGRLALARGTKAKKSRGSLFKGNSLMERWNNLAGTIANDTRRE